MSPIFRPKTAQTILIICNVITRNHYNSNRIKELIVFYFVTSIGNIIYELKMRDRKGNYLPYMANNFNCC